MSELRLFLLGAPRAEIDGRALEVDTRKALALLAYLALGEPRHRRDALAGVLWPDYDATSARGALRRTLSSLRKALGGRWVLADRSTISLDLDGLWVDASEFRRLASTGERPALERAAQLYRGGFLEGFSLRDAPEFEDWQYFQADELRRVYAGVLERLVDVLAEGGRFDDALERARRWLGLDPLHEPAHRTLMHLYAVSGRRADALRQYRECVSILDRELGVAPLPETVDLHERILRDELETRVPAASPVPRLEIAPTPLVGRAAEWAVLMRALSAPRTGGRLIVIEGEPGVGKTRLAEAYCEHVGRTSGKALRARCYEEESNLAYSPIVDLLRTAAQDEAWGSSLPRSARRAVGRLSPGLAPQAQDDPSDDPLAQRIFIDGLVEALLRFLATSVGPGVLFVDDLHWADAASLDLVSYVARRLAVLRVTVLVTWRSEQVPAGHRLRRLLAGLEAGDHAIHLTLARLTEPDIRQLVTSSGLNDVERMAARLYRETEGLPLFVSEYLAAIEARSHDEPWPLPAGVREIIRTRVMTISGIATQVLGAAACVGRSFDHDTVREASGRSDDETVAAIEELQAAGLIEEVDEVYDFGHDLVRSFVYEEMGHARRRLLHRRIALSLANRRRAATDGGRTAASIARHFHLGGEDGPAAGYFRIAGDQARAVYANAEALSHLRDALALGDEDTSALQGSIGDVLTLLGRYPDAIAAYEAAAAASDEDLQIAAFEHKIGRVQQRRGAWSSADTHYRAALESIGDRDDGLAARVYADRSLALHSQRAEEGALELAREALDLARSAGDEMALAQSHNILGIALTSLGRSEEARRHLAASLATAERVGDAPARIAALNNLALSARAAGDLDTAEKLTREGLELCARVGDRHREAALHNNLADLMRETGRTDEAMTHLKSAVAIFSDIGPPQQLEPEIWKLVEW